MIANAISSIAMMMSPPFSYLLIGIVLASGVFSLHAALHDFVFQFECRKC